MIEYLKRHAYAGLWLVALAVAAGVLLACEHHQLWKVQELNLFLWTPLFLKQQLVVSGGLLSWLGCFFTQFLYQPWLGVLLLCAWWWLLMWLLKRAFRLDGRWAGVLLIPVALLLAADMDMGYWIYTMKLRGWFFAATIGTTAVAALLWAFRVLPGRHGLRQAFIVLVTIAGYPLFGAYALAAALLMGLWAWCIEHSRGMAAANLLLALLCVVAVPLLYYRFVYYQTNLVNIYWTALPVFRIMNTYYLYYLPYYLLAAFFVMLTIVGWRKEESEKGKEVRGMWKGDRKVLLANGVLLAAIAVGVALSWFKDENFHHEVAMQHYVEQVRWGDVLKEGARQTDEPTRAIVMLRNLALSRLGRQGEEMYRYPNGSKLPQSVFPVQASLVVGSMVYYNYGMLNDCHHLCLEAGVEYGWRITHLTYMARAAMLNGDVKAMKKFTGVLKHTLYYAAWAEQLESLEHDRDRMAEAKETAPILHMLHYDDMAGADLGYTEKYLMGILSKMDSTDPYCQEQCLLATLWAKDAKLFWPRFIQYVRLHPQERLPRHYQEAACLFATQQHADLNTLPLDATVKQSYQHFMQLLKQYDGRDIVEVRKALFPQFGDTYFYDFYLLNKMMYF